MLIKILDSFMQQNTTLLLILAGIFVFILGEYFVVYYSKNLKRREGIIEYTIAIKIFSFLTAAVILLGTFLVIMLLALIIDGISGYYIQILMTIGSIALIVGFFWINSLVVKKYSKEVKHEHNFKKGDNLVVIKSGAIDGNWRLEYGENFEFVKNEKFDYITVKCKESGCYNDNMTFREDRFDKKKK